MMKKALSLVLAIAFLFTANAQEYRKEYCKPTGKLTKQERT
jgi:hypothetical protein